MLAQYMTWLASSPEAGREIGRRAAAHLREHHAVEHAARRYWEVLTGSGELALRPFDGGLELRATGYDKGTAVSSILSESSDALAAYLGDDLTDAPILARVGLSAAPANARPEIKQMVHLVTSASGGAGAVREVVELLLRAQGKWAEILRKYGISQQGS